LQFVKASRLPLARSSGNSDGYLNVWTPQRQSLLANAARGKDEKLFAGLAAGDARRRNFPNAKPIGLAKGSGLMAQAGSRIWWVKADAG
jgi:hypothetical protein